MCEEAILYWLDKQTHMGRAMASIGEFETSSYGAIFGRRFSSDDVQFAGQWLADRALIDTMGSVQLPVIRLSSNPKGQDTVENDETLDEWLRRNRSGPAPVPSVTNYMFGNVGNLNVRDRSPGGTQSIIAENAPEHTELTTAVANALVGLVAVLGLNAQQQGEVEQVVSELRSVAEEQAPDRSKLKQLFDRAATVAVAGTGAELGHGVVVLAHRALQALGLA